MSSNAAEAAADGITSYALDISTFDTQGFCKNYPLRRHRFEHEANAGCHEARLDWAEYVGTPTDRFGGCNPVNGNFTTLVLPLIKPERLRLVAYILEYAFLYDNIIETDGADTSRDVEGGQLVGQQGCRPLNLTSRRKHMEAKMILELQMIDKSCATRVMRAWNEMVLTTLREKDKNFDSLEEYVEFRIVDTGAPFVESMMLWGMGLLLTPEGDAQLADVIQPCFAALGLANDYFSFDREYAEMAETGATRLSNAVWLSMRWHGVNVDAAKNMVRDATTRYEQQFMSMSADFLSECAPTPENESLRTYLRALSYQISGNVIWSLNCPRYHPVTRYNPNAGAEDMITARVRSDEARACQESLVVPLERTDLTASSARSMRWPRDESDARSSMSRRLSTTEIHAYGAPCPGEKALLCPELVRAPFVYMDAMLSKDVREELIDALNVWLDVPEMAVSCIKSIIRHVHNASLILEDMQDGSPLRCGKPAAHMIFGAAQTINSANLAIVDAVNATWELSQPDAVKILTDELHNLHIGQGHDLYWTRRRDCPSEEEYMKMVWNKTGALFRLVSRLLMIGKTQDHTHVPRLVTLIGLHFQIRDDYLNLAVAEYSSQEGCCDNLDKGKFSFPLIHCLGSGKASLQLHEIMKRRRDSGALWREIKVLVLEELERTGSMDYTLKELRALEEQIEDAATRVERDTGRKNWVLRSMLHRLKV